MGRPERPVDTTVPARAELATVLRGLRTAAGLTYDELAVKTGISPTTLKRAASGGSVPSWETVTAIVETCGDPDGVVGQLWKKARIAERGRLRQLRRPGSPELITTRADLSEALEYIYEWAGAPPLRRLRERAGGGHLLPHSSAGRIVNREALPASRQQCFAFLTACGFTDSVAARWADAFDRVTGPSSADSQLLWEADARLAVVVEHLFRTRETERADRDRDGHAFLLRGRSTDTGHVRKAEDLLELQLAREPVLLRPRARNTRAA